MHDNFFFVIKIIIIIVIITMIRSMYVGFNLISLTSSSMFATNRR